jgi:hypothetical protein
MQLCYVAKTHIYVSFLSNRYTRILGCSNFINTRAKGICPTHAYGLTILLPELNNRSHN